MPVDRYSVKRMHTEPKGTIKVGVGGWVFQPWRGTFYPDALPQKQELAYASRRLTSIEINGTYYGSQKPESFARWHDETPEDFVFSLKGPRFTTNRRVLGEAAPSIERFLKSGIVELKRKLGPINWQFLPTKAFDPDDFEAFLKLLPPSIEGHDLRHVVEVRHASFHAAAFVALLREYKIACVLADSDTHPQIADPTAPFIYARLQGASDDHPTGYAPPALDAWAARACAWSAGKAADDLATLTTPEKAPPQARDVFIYMISGFKPKAPTAAMALIERLGPAR